MLDDRSYMRSSADPPRSMTNSLIVLLIIAFVAQSVLEFYFGYSWRHLALTAHGIQHGQVWQLFTFQFLHSTPWPWHVLGNCLALYFFGSSVEETLGSRKFVGLYFSCGLAGGILQFLATWLLPNHLDNPVVGASAGVLGIVATFATMFPERDVMTFLYFFPIRVKIKYLFWFTLFLSLYGTLVPYSNVAYGAHLGGMLLGYAYVRWVLEASEKWAFWRRFRRTPRPVELVSAHAPKHSSWRTAAKPVALDVTPDEFISREVDPILDKISAHGIQSLTERERKVLEDARKKMARR